MGCLSSKIALNHEEYINHIPAPSQESVDRREVLGLENDTIKVRFEDVEAGDKWVEKLKGWKEKERFVIETDKGTNLAKKFTGDELF